MDLQIIDVILAGLLCLVVVTTTAKSAVGTAVCARCHRKEDAPPAGAASGTPRLHLVPDPPIPPPRLVLLPPLPPAPAPFDWAECEGLPDPPMTGRSARGHPRPVERRRHRAGR
jgi:hypothetical protein